MSFLRRLGYFGFGAGLGCILVYALLIRDREFPAWLPEDRVIEELISDTIIVSPDLQLSFTDSVLVEKIKESDVRFRESIVRNEPCREYQLETEAERMRIKLCDSVPELVQYEPK